ncbi:sporulation transcriptional regulator SpoIIID [Huintestinicola sp.]
MNELTFDDKKERSEILGEYIIEKKSTVRAAAKAYGISKSTVHMDNTNTKKILTGIYVIVK